MYGSTETTLKHERRSSYRRRRVEASPEHTKDDCMSAQIPRRGTSGALQTNAGDVEAGFTASSFGGYEQGCGTLRSQGGDLGGGSETLLTQGADVYNGELTGETSATVTSATGIANASGPKVMASGVMFLVVFPDPIGLISKDMSRSRRSVELKEFA